MTRGILAGAFWGLIAGLVIILLSGLVLESRRQAQQAAEAAAARPASPTSWSRGQDLRGLPEPVPILGLALPRGAEPKTQDRLATIAVAEAARLSTVNAERSAPLPIPKPPGQVGRPTADAPVEISGPENLEPPSDQRTALVLATDRPFAVARSVPAAAALTPDLPDAAPTTIHNGIGAAAPSVEALQVSKRPDTPDVSIARIKVSDPHVVAQTEPPKRPEGASRGTEDSTLDYPAPPARAPNDAGPSGLSALSAPAIDLAPKPGPLSTQTNVEDPARKPALLRQQRVAGAAPASRIAPPVPVDLLIGTKGVEDVAIAFLLDDPSGAISEIPEWVGGVMRAGDTPITAAREAYRVMDGSAANADDWALSGVVLNESSLVGTEDNALRDRISARDLGVVARPASSPEVVQELRQTGLRGGIVYRGIVAGADDIELQLAAALSRGRRDGRVLVTVDADPDTLDRVAAWLSGPSGQAVHPVTVSAVLR